VGGGDAGQREDAAHDGAERTGSRHLRNLAAAAASARQPRYGPEEVPPTTARLLETVSAPALVVGRFLDVLAWNPLAGMLLGNFTRLPAPEMNLLFLFLHPQADQTCPNRKATVAELTAMLRTQVAAEPGHPRAEDLIARLMATGTEFTQLWGRHDVEEATRGQMRVNHPLVGELNLDWDAYPMPGTPGPSLIVCTTPPEGPDAERLKRLAGLTGEPGRALGVRQRAGAAGPEPRSSRNRSGRTRPPPERQRRFHRVPPHAAAIYTARPALIARATC
jgi:hypothetical protein